MHNALGYKTPRYLYEKGFELSSVLQSFQSYKMATGLVPGLADKDAAERGAAYAELLASADSASTPCSASHRARTITVPYKEENVADGSADLDQNVEEEEHDFFGFGALDKLDQKSSADEERKESEKAGDLFGLVDYESDVEDSAKDTSDEMSRKRKREPEKANIPKKPRVSAFSGVRYYEGEEEETKPDAIKLNDPLPSPFQQEVLKRAARDGGNLCFGIFWRINTYPIQRLFQTCHPHLLRNEPPKRANVKGSGWCYLYQTFNRRCGTQKRPNTKRERAASTLTSAGSVERYAPHPSPPQPQ